MDTRNINVLVLAYLGDAIYESYVRTYLVNKGINKINSLHKEAIHYVSASNQAKFVKHALDNNFFNEEEVNIIYRARNHKEAHKPKSTDIITYKYATGLEALIGFLYLEKKEERLQEIMKEVLNNANIWKKCCFEGIAR